jgi:hypothetical protein
VPLVIKWGDGTPEGSWIEPNSVSHQLIGTHDLVATLAALVGRDPGDNQAVDSFNFLPVLLGEQADDLPIRDHLLLQADRDPVMLFGRTTGSSCWTSAVNP